MAPKEKVKRRPKTAKAKRDSDSEDDGELFGTRIEEKKTQLIPPLNKADFKYWKPWLPESKLPKWAEDIQDYPLHVVMGDLDKSPLEILRAKRKPIIDLTKTVEVEGVSSIDFGRWKANDVIMNYVDKISHKKRP